MGDAAEMILDGILDPNGEYNPRGYQSYKGQRTSKRVRKIRKELARLIHQKQSLCTTDKQKNAAVNEARCEINRKYGSDWRSN